MIWEREINRDGIMCKFLSDLWMPWCTAQCGVVPSLWMRVHVLACVRLSVCACVWSFNNVKCAKDSICWWYQWAQNDDEKKCLSIFSFPQRISNIALIRARNAMAKQMNKWTERTNDRTRNANKTNRLKCHDSMWYGLSLPSMLYWRHSETSIN